MNNSQVAHLWANQSKPKAKGSNFYFEGKTIYSYGSHSPIARIFNENTILFNDSRYSNTTSQHQSYVRSAIDNSRYYILYLKDFNLDKNGQLDFVKTHEINLKYFKESLESISKQIFKSRLYKESLKDSFDAKLSDYKMYCKLFKLKVDKAVFKINNAKLREDIKKEREAKKERQAHYRQLEKERLERQLKINQTNLNSFLNGDCNKQTVAYRKGTNYLKIEGDKCITNSGAEVDKEKVNIIVSAIRKGISEAKLVGSRIGDFTINSFDETGIKIGCHFFDTQEIKRIIELF